jgi:Protein of unknown function (DUF3485)
MASGVPSPAAGGIGSPAPTSGTAGKSARPRAWLAWPIVVPAAVLAASIMVQGFHVFSQAHQGLPPHLAQALGAGVSDWTSQDLPLGENEFLSGEVEKVLNFDEVFYRSYSRGTRHFEVYVAYWGAGKMPTRMVASHTPDRCWTENGWQCTAMRFKVPEALDGIALQPVECRIFEPPGGGKPTYVQYWHLVSGRTYDYGNRFNAVPDPVRWWKDAIQQAVLGSREQYFIRLTSDEPLETLWNDPGFDEVLRRLGKIGLIASPSA